MDETEMTVDYEPTQDSIDFIDNQLFAYNFEKTKLGFNGHIKLVTRGPNNTIIGGIHGYAWGVCCRMETVWVDQSNRLHQLGRRLLELFELEAIRRGCEYVILETFSFQAPRFYEKNGYEKIASIEGYPTTNCASHVMKKSLKAIS